MHDDETDLNAIFRYFNKHTVISLSVNVFLKSTKYIASVSLYQFSICALLNACSVIGMVYWNKDGRV